MVEGVIPDADEVEGDEDKSDQVEAAAHDDAVPGVEDAAVEMSVADENVAVAAHGSQGHQGTHAGDGAEAGDHATESRNFAEEPPTQCLPWKQNTSRCQKADLLSSRPIQSQTLF